MFLPPHKGRVGSAIYFLAWLADRATKQSQNGQERIAWVYGRAPLKLGKIAGELQDCYRTIERHLERLRNMNYVIVERTPYGYIIGLRIEMPGKYCEMDAIIKKRLAKTVKSETDGTGDLGTGRPDNPVSESDTSVGRVAKNVKSNKTHKGHVRDNNKQTLEEDITYGNQSNPGHAVVVGKKMTSKDVRQPSQSTKAPSEIERQASQANPKLIDDLEELGIVCNTALELVEKYPPERICEVVRWVRKQGNQIRNQAGWVINALRRGWELPAEKRETTIRRTPEQVEKAKAAREHFKNVMAGKTIA